MLPFNLSRDIQSATGKLKRAVLQFTPETWTANKWLDPNSSFMRVVGVAILVVFFQVGTNYDFTRNIPTTCETYNTMRYPVGNKMCLEINLAI